ncbi:MAG: hypothetical protein ACR2RE_09485 [Geminicoccaceae bacterium]
MRKQYHARQVGQDRYVWDIHRLVRLASARKPQLVSISTIRELDENWWYQGESDNPTPRSLAHHMALVEATDLSHPIILCGEGRLMDGMHRLVKALLEERETVLAVKFEKTPEPDYINPAPESLSYEDEDL